MTTAQQLAGTARRVADTYPELLTPDEFDPARFPRDENHDGVVRHLPVQSRRRALVRLPAVLGRPAAVVVRTAAPLVTLPGRVVGLVALAEQTLTAMHTAVSRTDALLDRVEALTCTAEGVVQAASQAVTAAAGAAEEAHALAARAAPLLGHLDQAGPGINQLLDRVSQLSHMASRLPTVFRRRNHERSSVATRGRARCAGRTGTTSPGE